jgi:hypothetical protein
MYHVCILGYRQDIARDFDADPYPWRFLTLLDANKPHESLKRLVSGMDMSDMLDTPLSDVKPVKKAPKKFSVTQTPEA